jgi:phage tail-like protein
VRGLVDGLPSPHPIGALLPALYQEDGFVQRFTSGLDEVIAPALAVLDNLPSYLDPVLTPDDFLPWLAGWVGIALDENWPLARRRQLVARAGDLYRARGTARGLSEQVELLTGSAPRIEESGGTVWSPTPGAAPPGKAVAELVVTVREVPGQPVDRRRLDSIVRDAKPAAVSHRIEVVPA